MEGAWLLRVATAPRQFSVAGVSKWAFAVRALRSRNYRLFFTGQSVSLVGTWMTRIATSWLIYRLTDSAFLLGMVSFAGQIPSFLITPLAGVWVDRWDRHRTLVVTQILSTVQSFGLGILALTHVITVWHVILLALFQGVINAFDMPARQSFVIQMVEDRADLGNAIALNSSMVNAAGLVGPAIAGVVIAATGEAWCFLLDGISYLAVILSLLLMKIPASLPRAAEKQVLQELVEGWRYVVSSPPIRSILLLLGLVSFVGMPYTVLMPIFADSVLHGGPHTLGFLMAASGVGALFSAITLALRRTVLGLGKMIPISAALFGVGLIVFSRSHVLWLSILMMLVTGFGMMQQMAASNTILQTIVDEGKRGRVMSYYTMAFVGVAPFGSLVAGTAAARIGAPDTLIIGGLLCIAGAAIFAGQLRTIRRSIRPIYVELGILPEVASGLQTAAALHVPPQD